MCSSRVKEVKNPSPMRAALIHPTRAHDALSFAIRHEEREVLRAMRVVRARVRGEGVKTTEVLRLFEILSETRESFEKKRPFEHVEGVRYVDGYAHIRRGNFASNVRFETENVGASWYAYRKLGVVLPARENVPNQLTRFNHHVLSKDSAQHGRDANRSDIARDRAFRFGDRNVFGRRECFETLPIWVASHFLQQKAKEGEEVVLTATIRAAKQAFDVFKADASYVAARVVCTRKDCGGEGAWAKKDSIFCLSSFFFNNCSDHSRELFFRRGRLFPQLGKRFQRAGSGSIAREDRDGLL